MKLRVVQSFADYSVGDEITDEKIVNSIMNSAQRYFVVVVNDTKPAALVTDKPSVKKSD